MAAKQRFAEVRLLKDETKATANRVIRMLASAPSVDSHGTTINPNGWKLDRYMANPVVCFGHETHKLPIARAAGVYVQADGLVIDVEFPPEGTYEFADVVFRMMNAGFLRGGSVGFWPMKWKVRDDEDVIDILEQDLFEFSIVTVPSNPDTLKKDAAFEAALQRAIERNASLPNPELRTVETTTKATSVALNRARRQVDVNRNLIA